MLGEVCECCWRFVAGRDARYEPQEGYDSNASSATLQLVATKPVPMSKLL
jgi:hypothetical protein